jgi:hypothetical protein
LKAVSILHAAGILLYLHSKKDFMNEKDLVIYSDKRNVKITTSEFIVDSGRYLLNGIDKVRLHFIRHHKLPPLTMLGVGVMAILFGITGVLRSVEFEQLYIGGFMIDASRLSAMIGSALLFMSLLWLLILHNEYLLVITTADGDKIPLSSKKKEYVNRIVSALKVALNMQKSIASASQEV